MIDFKAEFESCNKLYDSKKEVIDLNSNNIIIKNFQFHSSFMAKDYDNQVVSGDLYYHEITQGKYYENDNFTYPVVMPASPKKFQSGILFFHGLNERSWNKYFVWAKYLAEQTQRPVIMFPIAYHINRAPKCWSDPHCMMEVANARKKEEHYSTFVNAALSTRLEKTPERFLVSGLQSYYDALELIESIKSGDHPAFEIGAHLDIFSYSIGAFLSEILMLNNYKGVLSTAKLFMFCGGTTFDSMNGISKFIMDEKAFSSLKLMNEKKNLKNLRNELLNFKLCNLKYIWQGVTMMMANSNRRSKREKLLRKCANRIFAVAIEKDSVIPADKIIETLKGRKGDIPVKVEVIDFPYDYSHEQPFPINDPKSQPFVNRCFTVVFDKAVNFYLSTK